MDKIVSSTRTKLTSQMGIPQAHTLQLLVGLHRSVKMRLVINQCSFSPPLHYSLVPSQARSYLLSINCRFGGTTHENSKLIGTSLAANIQKKIRGNGQIDKGDDITNSSTHALQAEESGLTRGEEAACRVKLQTLNGCRLGIGTYPDFEYNAGGGGGDGVGENLSGGRVEVKFDVGSLYIPPLTYQTTKFLGLPLPPILSISILPQALQGFMDQDTGKVELNFRANFCLQILSLYKPPPLQVETVLTTEEFTGKMRNGKGQRLNSEGCCKLVGVATVVPINDSFLDAFLNLPTECLADLSAKILLTTTL